MIAATLLEALREKDPGAYGAWKAMHDVYSIREGCAMSDAWVQAVLQDACQVRGWAITLTYNPPSGPDAPFWECHVWPDDRCRAAPKADSPTEALLRCYLEALPIA